MASYRDYMKIDNPNKMSESFLKKAIRSMANAANKRLRRMEERGQTYYMGEEGLTGKGYTAGYKRFGIAGKDITELQNEFKRVRSFLLNPLSSLTGMKEELKKAREQRDRFTKRRKKSHRMTKKERKDYERMKKEQQKRGAKERKFKTMWEELVWFNRTVRLYMRLVDEHLYNPTPYDSNQVRDIIENVTYQSFDDISEEEQYEIIKEKVKSFLGQAENKRGTTSTSDFFEDS